MQYTIKTREEYETLKKRGIDALFYNRGLRLNHRLRLELQEEFFGRGNHQNNNQKFYSYAWKSKSDHICEECMRPLPSYSATFISHIQSKGAHPETAYDLRNINFLCPECHAKWENGNRDSMRINHKNQIILNLLKNEYSKSQNMQVPDKE